MTTIAQRLIFVALIGYLYACSGISVQTDNRPIFAIANQIVDIAKKTSVDPSSASTVQYSESDQFDLALLASMKGTVSPITVQMDGSLSRLQLNDARPITRTTPRIERWLWKIRNTQGEVIACKVGSRALWIVLVPIVIGLIADVIRDYVTYQPAKNYNAKIFFDPDTDIVHRIEFHRRTQEPFHCN